MSKQRRTVAPRKTTAPTISFTASVNDSMLKFDTPESRVLGKKFDIPGIYCKMSPIEVNSGSQKTTVNPSCTFSSKIRHHTELQKIIKTPRKKTHNFSR